MKKESVLKMLLAVRYDDNDRLVAEWQGWEEVNPYVHYEFKATYKNLDIYTDLGSELIVEHHKKYDVAAEIVGGSFDDPLGDPLEVSDESRFAKLKKAIDGLQGTSIEKSENGLFENLIYLAPFKVEFSDVDEDKSVGVRGTNQFGSICLGELDYDPDQKAWVLWYGGGYSDEGAAPENPDGVTYFDSLKETEAAIQEDYEEN